MRHLMPSLLAVFCVLASPGAVRAEETESPTESEMPDAKGWGRHGVGTSIHHRTTTEATQPGAGTSKFVTETKKTLVRITDTHYVLEVVHTLAGRATTTEEKIAKTYTGDGFRRLVPFAAGIDMKREELGTENVTVDGKAYECEKAALTISMSAIAGRGVVGGGRPGGKESFTTTVWEHAEHGLLKMTSTGGWGMDMEVTKLDAPLTVGDVALSCKVSTLTSSRSGMTTKRFESRDVPEDLVRSETTIEQGRIENRIVVELIELVRKAP